MDLKTQISALVDKNKEMSKAETEAGEEGPTVTEDDIQHIVSSWTGISVERAEISQSNQSFFILDVWHTKQGTP